MLFLPLQLLMLRLELKQLLCLLIEFALLLINDDILLGDD
jgi:hypothetical protein